MKTLSGSSVRAYVPAVLWLAGSILFFPQMSAAKSAGPFADYAGSWRGTGRVTGMNGGSEPIRCRATYTVSSDGASLSQTLVCASDSYRFDIRSNLISDGRNAQGTWQETTRAASGNLVGRVGKGLFEGVVTGSGFSAQLWVRTTGPRQSVIIDPHGTDVSKVDISLTR